MPVQSRFIERIFFDLSKQLKVRVAGADRLRFLNGQITNDVRKASESSAIEACILNAKGKMDAHLFVHAEGDSFVLDADPALEPSLQPRLERYVIADDVQIENVTARLSIFHLLGEAVPELPPLDPHLNPLDAPPGRDPGEEGAKRQVRVETDFSANIVSANRFGLAGYDIWISTSELQKVRTELEKNFELCDENCAETFRILWTTLAQRRVRSAVQAHPCVLCRSLRHLVQQRECAIVEFDCRFFRKARHSRRAKFRHSPGAAGARADAAARAIAAATQTAAHHPLRSRHLPAPARQK